MKKLTEKQKKVLDQMEEGRQYLPSTNTESRDMIILEKKGYLRFVKNHYIKIKDYK